MARRRRAPSSGERLDEALAVLGLAHGATVDDVAEARRRLAKVAHPDAGGSDAAMQRVNEAARRVLDHLAAPAGTAPSAAPPAPAPSPAPPGPPGPHGRWIVRHDHPSFTIEALPVEAFEGLLVVASWLGDLIDDDPPYRLEVALAEPLHTWCRLDVVPDAGASTVSLTVAAEPEAPPPDVDGVRDAWIEGLNRLDWRSLDPSPPPPLP